ncbi:MAG: mechanosensitive ion channel family protein [Pseudomonadota bacterium]|nr:mechanosensitive ion channel family protein [Pseudomonadota bacterium]
MRTNERPIARLFQALVLVSLLPLVFALSASLAGAQESGDDPDPEPLRPPDTSSPRDTLRSFLTNVSKISEDRRQGTLGPETYRAFRRVLDTLDFTTTPEGDSWFVRTLRMSLLQEVLARIELPPENQIPGDEEVADRAATHWTIPNTRIRIERIEQGPQAGEFLFSADTVAKIDRLYRHAKHLPYKQGAIPGSYEDLVRAENTVHARERKLRNRLRPVDTSNPRATLDGFLDSINRAHVLVMETNAGLRATPPTIPNSEAVSKNIDNMGMRTYRRVYTKVGIRYDTPPERVEAFLEGIKRIIQANPTTRKDYFHVVLNDFGPDSLVVMLYFFVKVPDWSAELVERQRVFLEVIRLADALGVGFAFPTQTLEIESFPGQPGREPRPAASDDELRRIAEDFGRGTSARPGGLGIFVPPHEEHAAKS